MADFALITDIALIWCVALIAGLACVKLKQPVIAGYMIAGVVVGPHGLGWINQTQQVRLLAEFGVAMLLFTLGVDLSLKQVISSAKRILTAGIAQVVGTLCVAWLIGWFFGLVKGPGEGFLFGSICAISSSVVISRTLTDRGELESVHGRILVMLSLVQDLCLIVIIPFLPLLQDNTHGDLLNLLQSLAKAVSFMLIVVFGTTRLVPIILEKAVKTNSKEIFLLTIVVLCLGISVLSQSLGLSIAFGAFIAGIMMSESTYAHQALHDVAPLRDVFSTVFFVSVGMLLDPTFIAHNWQQVAAFVFVLIFGKAVIGSLAALFATRNLRSAILVGTGLSQIGEFSFVLLTLGYSLKWIGEPVYNLFFAGAVVSMIASPLLMAVVPFLMRQRFHEPQKRSLVLPSAQLQQHVLLCGYGRIGRNLGQALEILDLPFIVIELNADIVEDLAVRGVRHLYGDAMNQTILEKARLQDASVLVLTMPDPLAAKAVASFARKQNPSIKIIARAHRTSDIQMFRSAGVNAVVQPEFEAGIEITRLMLHGLKRPSSEVSRALNEMKTRRYAMFQPDIEEAAMTAPIDLSGDQIGLWFTVASEDVQGKTISDLNVRSETGATITAVKRREQTLAFPNPTFSLKIHDEVYAVGNSTQLFQLEQLISCAR